MDQQHTSTFVAEPQSAPAVLMVRPAAFGFNVQTAVSNAFQNPPETSAGGASVAAASNSAQRLALREFDGVVGQLQRAGVEVVVAEDSKSPAKPDALFPNNWVSFHRDGTVILYPMLAPNRRLERREEFLEQIARGGYRISRTVDLTYREAQAQYLEGTGSLVLDRCNRIAYACLSPRTDLDVLGEFAQLMDYELVTFEAVDAAQKLVYHTNVVMAIGARIAVVCGAAIVGSARRAAVIQRLRSTGHDLVEVSVPQMHRFAANLLELTPAAGNVIALSTSAWESFDAVQRRRFERHGSVVIADVPTIEHLGGGGVRCMLAEIHLPRRVSPPVS